MNTTQLNLKFQDTFLKKTKAIAESQGYLSVQEFIREAIRDKIASYNEIRSDYRDILKSQEANTFMSVADSKKTMQQLRNKAKKE